MRHYLSLLVTVSYVFFSNGVLSSSVTNDDDHPDRRAQESNSAPLMTFVERDGKKLWTNALSGLAHHVRVEVMEYLHDDPRGQLSLMTVSHGFRRLALVMPGRYDDTASTGTGLKRRLLKTLIGVLGVNLNHFIKDDCFKTFKYLSLGNLQDVSRYYNHTLSIITRDGTYRSVGSWDMWDINSKLPKVMALELASKLLRLASLNFPEASTIYELNLNDNQLRTLPDLSYLKNLCILNLSNNQLREFPDLTSFTNLRRLDIQKNQLSDVSGLSHLTQLMSLNLYQNQLREVPNLSLLTNLTSLSLYRNPLRTTPDLSHLTNLKGLWLSLDASLCEDATVLESLRTLNRNRIERDKVKLFKCSIIASRNMLEEVPLT